MREIEKIIDGDKIKFETDIDLTTKTEKEFKDYIERYMELYSYRYSKSFFMLVEDLPTIDNNLRADLYFTLIDIDRLDATYKNSLEVDIYNRARVSLLDILMSIPNYMSRKSYIDFIFSGGFTLVDIYGDVGYTDKEVRSALLGGDANIVIEDIQEKIDGSVEELKKKNLKGLLAGKISIITLYTLFVFLILNFLVNLSSQRGLLIL